MFSPNSSATTSDYNRNISTTGSRRVSARRSKGDSCVRLLTSLYHKYQLKHVVLVAVLLLYTFIGAFLFLVVEEPVERKEKIKWTRALSHNRTIFVDQVCDDILNNTVYYLYATQRASYKVHKYLHDKMELYEKQLAVKFSKQKIEWDYWNSMLYAITIFTTIGYGHIYPRTSAGRVITMIYALFGIPLVLTILNDLGKLLTVMLKYPWFLTKKCFRRIKRLCFKTPMFVILSIERVEYDNLQIFDLPIPLAIALVFGWIFACSATFCIWETRWSYLEAFYFFFISLSTIGLGDILPDHPKYLLIMFGYIIIGLSLVSMSINLIQSRLEKTYQSGLIDRKTSAVVSNEKVRPPILGVFRALFTTSNLTNEKPSGSMATLLTCQNVQTQTELCFPTKNFLLVKSDGESNVVADESNDEEFALLKKSEGFGSPRFYF